MRAKWSMVYVPVFVALSASVACSVSVDRLDDGGAGPSGDDTRADTPSTPNAGPGSTGSTPVNRPPASGVDAGKSPPPSQGMDAGAVPPPHDGTDAGGGRSDAGRSDANSGAPADCSSPNLVWKTGNKTNYESYPPPGSSECVDFNGCAYEGLFSACSSKRPLSWVKSHNIVSVFPNLHKASKGIGALELHDLCLRDPNNPSNTIVVTVLDECADSDCSGCCTQNKGSSDQLIDIERYTNAKWGVRDGKIQWADLGPTKGSGCQ